MKITQTHKHKNSDFTSVIKRLLKYFNITSQKELSKRLAVNYATFSTWARRGKIPYALLIDLSINHNISLDWLLVGESANDKLYGQNKIGSPKIINDFTNKDHKNIDILEDEERVKDKLYLSVSKNLIDKFSIGGDLDSLKMVTVVGSSMSPTINSGDKVFISDINKDEEIYNSIMYLVVYKNRTYVKRIQINPVTEKIRLISDNEKYETFEILKENKEDFRIIGRVVSKCTFDNML